MADDYSLRAKRQPWTVDHSGHQLGLVMQNWGKMWK